jgi:hypothetical protein
LNARPSEPPIKPVPMMVTCLKGIESFVIPSKVRDPQFAADYRSLASLGMTILIGDSG